MKLTLRGGNSREMRLNMDKAKLMLGEKKFLSFKPHPRYKVKDGFVAVYFGTLLHAQVVLVRSRGWYIEIRTVDDLFLRPTFEWIKNGLWVPLKIGIPIPGSVDNDPRDHIDESEHEEFAQLLLNARL